MVKVMEQQYHIINRQIIELHMPKKSNVQALQKKVAHLCQNKLRSILDQQLTARFGGNDKKRHQFERLTIDLGEVKFEDIEAVFAEQLAQAINDQTSVAPSTEYEEENATIAELTTTPMKLLGYYLKTGILPWWSEDKSIKYIHKQLDTLLETPNPHFKELLGQFQYHPGYLERFLNTFTEKQLLQSLQLLTDISLEALSDTKKELLEQFNKATTEWVPGLKDFELIKAFWTAAFEEISTAKDFSVLEWRITRQVFQELWVGSKNEGSTSGNTALVGVKAIVKRLKTQYSDNPIWQSFAQRLSLLSHHSTLRHLDARLLEEFLQRLGQLESTLGIPSAEERPGVTRKAVTNAHLQPVLEHLQVMEAIMKQVQSGPIPDVLNKLSYEFEETDFITVQNAGLVILWPFLQRFFDNMELMEGKAFHDEVTRSKAACTLQYLTGMGEEEIFEGQLPLNKVLCGIPLEDTVEVVALSPEEKKMAEGLLQSAITRGPHWKNLTLEGFRSSYLRREGSLRMKEGHWLLQVEKETYDITLEKLPWGFTVVKLPWMQAPLMVEWV